MQKRGRTGLLATVAAGAAVLVTVGLVGAPKPSEAELRVAPARATPSAPQQGAAPTSGAPATGATAPGKPAPGKPAPGKPAPGKPAKVDKPSREQAAADAKAVVARHGAAVRAGRNEAYQVRSVLVDDDGGRHVRFDRTYNGLPVIGGDYVVHANADGSLHGATVAQDQTITIGTRPTITAERADAIAAGAFGGKVDRTTPTLVVDAAAGAPVLAWRVLVEGSDHRSVEVIVDAGTGAVRRSVDTLRAADGSGHGFHSGEVPLSTTERNGVFELVDPVRGNGETRDARDTQRPGRLRTRAFTDPDNVWGDGTLANRSTLAVDVHHGVARTWDYFLRAHGRNGIADDGRGALAVVHDAWLRPNAVWDDTCFCMRFTDGDATIKAFTSLDIVAHEMAHGVTTATADLNNYGHSGALDEANSDIFGTLVEFDVNSPVDPPDYMIGELLDDGGDGKPLRYMDEPTRDGVSLSCWDGTSNAGTDVHYLSGVPNKFFYSLAEGSAKSTWGESVPCGTAAPVVGIGREKAGAIWYRALTRYMVSTTDFPGARAATLRAAADLYGTDSAERAAVQAAWKAVRIDGLDPKSQAPSVTAPADQKGMVGDVVRLQVEAVDEQGDAFTFTAENLPDGLTISDSGLITGTLRKDQTYATVLTVTDAGGYTTTVSFAWDVRGGPVIKDPGPQLGALDRLSTLTITAEDRDEYYLTWTFTGLPDGIEPYWENSDGVLGYPTKVGTFPVTVTVTDREGLSSSVTFTWTIKETLPPGPPTHLTATRAGTEVTVDWETPDIGWLSVTGYEVTASPGDVSVTLNDWFPTEAVLQGLDPAQAYTISVAAVNAVGRGEPATVEVPAVSAGTG